MNTPPPPPPILPSPLFSTSVQPPLPCHLQPSPTQLFLWLNGWLNDHIWCAILLNDRYYGSAHVETWYLSARRTWCVFCSTRRQVYWGLTHVIFCWYSDLILHTNKQAKQTNTHTHTERHTAHSGASRLTHSYKYIFTPPFICSQQLSLLFGIDNSLIYKNSFPRCLFFPTIIHLKRSYLLIRCYKTKFLKSYWCK